MWIYIPNGDFSWKKKGKLPQKGDGFPFPLSCPTCHGRGPTTVQLKRVSSKDWPFVGKSSGEQNNKVILMRTRTCCYLFRISYYFGNKLVLHRLTCNLANWKSCPFVFCSSKGSIRYAPQLGWTNHAMLILCECERGDLDRKWCPKKLKKRMNGLHKNRIGKLQKLSSSIAILEFNWILTLQTEGDECNSMTLRRTRPGR